MHARTQHGRPPLTVARLAHVSSQGFSAMILAGPFMCGFTQTINDWFDRDLDAINEPYAKSPANTHRSSP